MLLLCATTVSFTSCLSDDGDSSSKSYQATTADMKVLYTSAIVGSYSGYTYYLDADTISKTDSAAVKWITTSTDSTITFYKFPFSVLADYLSVNNNTEAAALVKALPNTNLVMHYYIPTYTYMTYYNQGIYTYTVVPDSNKIEINNDGKKFVFTFADSYTYYNNTYYAYGTAYNKKYQQYIIFNKVSIDGIEYNISKLFLIQSHS
jgi:hypothetical protein